MRVNVIGVIGERSLEGKNYRGLGEGMVAHRELLVLLVHQNPKHYGSLHSMHRVSHRHHIQHAHLNCIGIFAIKNRLEFIPNGCITRVEPS